MRKFVIAAAIAAAGVLSVATASQVAPTLASGRPVLSALRSLDLSDTQRSAIRDIVKERRGSANAEREKAVASVERFMALDPNAAGYTQDVSALSATIQQTTQARVMKLGELQRDIYAVLTPAQRQQVPQLIANAQLDRAGDALNGRVMRALDQLALTDEQWISLRHIREAHKAQAQSEREAARKEWMAFAALDPSAATYDRQVASMASSFGQRAAAKTLEAAALQKQVYAVLTPEQRSQLITTVDEAVRKRGSLG